MTNTLTQLKFDAYVKANQASIIKTSEQADDVIVNLRASITKMDKVFDAIGDSSNAMSSGFSGCNKELTKTNYDMLSKLLKITTSKAYTDMLANVDTIKAALDKTCKKD